METEHVLTVNCADSPGIVHAITGFLLDHDCDIIDTKHFGDRHARQFFMRVHLAAGKKEFSTEELRSDFEPLAGEWRMNWQLEPHGRKRPSHLARYAEFQRDLAGEQVVAEERAAAHEKALRES